MLRGLLGRIGEVDAAAADLPISAGTWLRWTIQPQGASWFVGDAVAKLQQVVADNPALLRPGATVLGGRGDNTVLIEGRAALDWGQIGDFLDSAEQVFYASVPHSVRGVEADIFEEVLPGPNDLPPTSPANPTPPASDTNTTQQTPRALPSWVWIAGGVALLAMWGKGK